MTVQEAADRANEVRKEAGPPGQMLTKADIVAVYEAVGLDGEEVFQIANALALAFGTAAEVDRPPYKSVISGMWSDGFITGVIYGRSKAVEALEEAEKGA